MTGAVKPKVHQRLIIPTHDVDSDITAVSGNAPGTVTLTLQTALPVNITGTAGFNIPCFTTNVCAYVVNNGALEWHSLTAQPGVRCFDHRHYRSQTFPDAEHRRCRKSARGRSHRSFDCRLSYQQSRIQIRQHSPQRDRPDQSQTNGSCDSTPASSSISNPIAMKQTIRKQEAGTAIILVISILATLMVIVGVAAEYTIEH